MIVSRTYGPPALAPDGVILPSTVNVPRDMPAMDRLRLAREGRLVVLSVEQLDTATLSIGRASVSLDARAARHALTLLTAIVEDLERIGV